MKNSFKNSLKKLSWKNFLILLVAGCDFKDKKCCSRDQSDGIYYIQRCY